MAVVEQNLKRLLEVLPADDLRRLQCVAKEPIGKQVLASDVNLKLSSGPNRLPFTAYSSLSSMSELGLLQIHPAPLPEISHAERFSLTEKGRALLATNDKKES